MLETSPIGKKGSDSMALPQERIYTIEDIDNLPGGVRAELIDGQIYYMAAPNRIHQKILGELYATIHQYIKSKGGSCDVYPAPFAVYFGKDENYLEPDISVVCDKNKLTERGCNGAPDWVVEIVSPGNPSHDYITKLALYKAVGVKEYWIVNPKNQIIIVYYFESETLAQPFTFKDKIKVNIYDDLVIDFGGLDI